MKKLKIILLFSFFVIFIIRIIMVINYNSIYKDGLNIVEGYISDIKYDENYISLIINGKERILAITSNIDNLNYGDYVLIKGVISDPSNNTVFNLFNYKKYLLSKRIYKTIKVEEIIKIKDNTNILYSLKNRIIIRLNTINNSYLNTLILGDNVIDDKIYEIYQNNGISHLFSISGMHINLFSLLLLKIFNKIFKNRRISYFFTSIILLIYMILINTPSIIRSVLLFIILSFKKVFNLNVETDKIILLILVFLLFININYVYDAGFKYSFIISYALIKFNYLYKDKNYIIKSILISLIALLSSFPISINNNFFINLTSLINNLIFVPLVSFVVFPFSIIVFIFPSLNNLYNYLINILENLSIFMDEFSINVMFGYMNVLMVLIYYVLLYLLLKKINKRNFMLLIVFFIIHYNIHEFNINYKITMIDVGQGDSTLIEMKNDTVILIDTGGIYNSSMVNSRIIPYMKKLGIRELDYLILTHGDYDHMGEAINLVNNFRVEKVIFNCGEFNELEQDLIKVLDKKKIPYYSCIKELNVDKNKLYFLQTKEYNNENDNSNVIYTELNGYKFMFMGDAGVEVEEDLIEKYNLNNIDVLKVGHHGSKTSSSKSFIDEINPKYSIISAGKNNRYGHPNKEVLESLKDTKIFRTDQDGSIMFKIKNNKLKIETCSP